ncbi:MAG: hypothetical protein KME54_01835 [Tolypothrix brevis GSE-NOS-MK-07-07A]|nr:hypothetical protein [Tolypothrix brevis GSE-NOS-MK-07-07A]
MVQCIYRKADGQLDSTEHALKMRGVRAEVANGVVPMGSRESKVSGQSERRGYVVKLHI